MNIRRKKSRKLLRKGKPTLFCILFGHKTKTVDMVFKSIPDKKVCVRCMVVQE